MKDKNYDYLDFAYETQFNLIKLMEHPTLKNNKEQRRVVKRLLEDVSELIEELQKID